MNDIEHFSQLLHDQAVLKMVEKQNNGKTLKSFKIFAKREKVTQKGSHFEHYFLNIFSELGTFPSLGIFVSLARSELKLRFWGPGGPSVTSFFNESLKT